MCYTRLENEVASRAVDRAKSRDEPSKSHSEIFELRPSRLRFGRLEERITNAA
jgi:hypothetical protein